MNRYLNHRIASILFASFLVCNGCVTTTTKNGKTIPNEPSALTKTWTKVKNSSANMLSAITPKDSVDPIPWQWTAGMPQSVAKGEAIVPIVPQEALLAFAPDANLSQIQLVSTGQPQSLPIAVVNETRVRNVADLHAGIVSAIETPSKDNPTIELATGMTGEHSTPVRVTRNNLIALAHTAIPDRSAIRVVEDSNPWVLIKDDNVRCKVMLRTEEQSDLVHLVMSLKVCWGQPKTLPVDLKVLRDGRELSCLNVSQILNRLYDDPKNKRKREAKSSQSATPFSQIAGDDEYLLPKNYRELEALHAANSRLASIRPTSAFAVVGGYSYPGPPVLGDARALSSFLLQPRIYSADEPEQVGWVVFDSPSPVAAENYEVVIDLGSGPQKVQFRIPKSGS